MLQFLKMNANQTYTENGALTLLSTGSDCLDLFARIGGMRYADSDEVLKSFIRAYGEDPDLAMKILFYARDVRGGLGERRIFREIMHWLGDHEPLSVRKNIEYIAEYGRFDDLLCLLHTKCEEDVMVCIEKQLKADLQDLEEGKNVSLLGKWLPSVNASSKETVRAAKRIARHLSMEDAEYRKMLSSLRGRISIIENNLRCRAYNFDYSRQPSQALVRYRKAFLRNDAVRYERFIELASRGKVKMNTNTLTPYEIVAPLYEEYWDYYTALSEEEKRAIDVTWRLQEDYTLGENALVVADGSGSMYCGDKVLPAAVAQSLAVYFAERNHGAFHNHFITFSERPQLIEIKGKDIAEKLRYCGSFDEVANTNIERVFQLILKTAVENGLRQKDMPSRLYIISDMEFDMCADGAEITNFDNAKKLYAQHGYQLPQIVFWNVASRNRQMPVSQNEQGAALVSGSSPRTFSMLKKGIFSPMECMMEILGSERYRKIAA